MPNRTTPEFWNDDVTLNTLTRDAELFFRKVQALRCDDHRFPIVPTPQKPENLRAKLYYLRAGVTIKDVARWLEENRAKGTIIIRDSERGWYCEIPDHLRYHAEDFAKGAARHGPRRKNPPSQPQLPGLVAVVSHAPKPMKTSRSYVYESVIGNDNESARERVGTRALPRGEDSPESSEDEALARLPALVGLHEAALNRGLWITYYREDRVAFAEMLGSGELWKRERKIPKTSWAAMLTDEFKRIRDERRAA